jgi:uncharacterized protein (TIGR03083 family)
MPDPTTWITALSESHDRLTGLLSDIDEDTLRSQSYDDEWSIADVASHLGSQAEIFDMFVTAGLTGAEPPGNDAFPAIWERWNALPPTEQAAESLAANGALIRRLAELSADQQQGFTVAMFGSQRDLADVVAMRLSEHAVHTWDIAVAVDPSATILPDAVNLLIDMVTQYAGRGKPVDGMDPVPIVTTAPNRTFRLILQPSISLDQIPDATQALADGSDGQPLRLPAEAFIRLLYGRLDAEHTPRDVSDDARLPGLRQAFPGF